MFGSSWALRQVKTEKNVRENSWNTCDVIKGWNHAGTHSSRLHSISISKRDRKKYEKKIFLRVEKKRKLHNGESTRQLHISERTSASNATTLCSLLSAFFFWRVLRANSRVPSSPWLRQHNKHYCAKNIYINTFNHTQQRNMFWKLIMEFLMKWQINIMKFTSVDLRWIGNLRALSHCVQRNENNKQIY